jgi:hypothetical protein
MGEQGGVGTSATYSHPPRPPRTPAAWGRALAYAWAADLYLAMCPRQIEEARASARKALQLQPNFWYVNEVVMPRLK